MNRLGTRIERDSIQGRMLLLIAQVFVPVIAVQVFFAWMLFAHNLQYASVSGNIIAASGFNQDFKDDVDLKMYQYVTGSSRELPWKEIDAAQALAAELLDSTRDGESRKAIANVLTLCDNLRTSVTKIQEAEHYDQRMEQLDANIYIITGLIQERIYIYLYREAGVMAGLHNQLNLWLWLEMVVAVAVLLVVTPVFLSKALRLSRSITDPIDRLSRRVEDIGQGDLTERTPVGAQDARLQMLSRGVEDMVGKLNTQIELNRQEQERLRGIELALIQAQINPHFLYNTLDAIVWLIETGKNDQAEQMITSLSTYFRSFLSNGKDIISLAEEEQHVRSYLEIQQVRYRDILEYTVCIDAAARDSLLPKLTLQPLVENAIYHGLKPKRGRGRVEVTGRCRDNQVILQVSDTGVGMTEQALEELRGRIQAEDTSSFGLVAVRKRLKLVYAEQFRLQVDSRAGAGTTITIAIPQRWEDGHERTV